MFVNAFRSFGAAYRSHLQGPSMGQELFAIDRENLVYGRHVFLPERQGVWTDTENYEQ